MAVVATPTAKTAPHQIANRTTSPFETSRTQPRSTATSLAADDGKSATDVRVRGRQRCFPWRLSRKGRAPRVGAAGVIAVPPAAVRPPRR
jgi:hypothetical protein